MEWKVKTYLRIYESHCEIAGNVYERKKIRSTRHLFSYHNKVGGRRRHTVFLAHICVRKYLS